MGKRDSEIVQTSLFEYLYFTRNLLIHRKRALQLSYDVFIYGLAMSVVLFTIAILWR